MPTRSAQAVSASPRDSVCIWQLHEFHSACMLKQKLYLGDDVCDAIKLAL